jgi:polyketide cyclase/dehydrase/lipid transport protein
VISEYHFITRWRFFAPAGLIFDVISNPLEYPRWWPEVYLNVQELDCGDDCGLGRRIHLHTRGWLPYTLDWESCAVDIERPSRLAIRATGDFVGRGIWTLREDGEFTDIEFNWKIAAQKPLLRYFSFLLRWVFSANHRSAMERGREGLEKELKRLQTKAF